MHSRVIQAIALVVILIGSTAGGMLLPPLLSSTDRSGLRYTDVSVKGAPPFVVLGTAVGALRGLIVDYLWIKVNYMKEKGLFFEVMADADLITKLQPRFVQVWAFHGHNMAYNISVATHTQEERWEWVNAGIRLVRMEGLKHNPNDLVLHKTLAFWFAHKLEGYSDDAHLYYKYKFADEWHHILGPPPDDYEQRIAWIKIIADAPRTLNEAELRTPGVHALIEEYNDAVMPFSEGMQFQPNRDFLRTWFSWRAQTGQSAVARELDLTRLSEIVAQEGSKMDVSTLDPQRREVLRRARIFVAIHPIFSTPENQEALNTLVAFVQKHVLLEEYNMDPQLMYRYTAELGPIDWRHGQAHALYWSRRGMERGEARVADENDIYKIVNNDRMQLQAMQGLARYGRISFDPFSTELPARFPDPRWIDTIEKEFRKVYTKHYDTRGAGGDSIARGFLPNFMSSSIREAYRAGELDRAEKIMKMLDDMFGFNSEGDRISHEYNMPLDVFVANQIRGQLTSQTHLAPSEAVAAMQNGFRFGVGRDRREVYEQAEMYAAQIIQIYRNSEDFNYETHMGTGRMRDLVKDLPTTKYYSFLQLMTDPNTHLQERATIWTKVDKYERNLRAAVYDQMLPSLQSQYNQHPLSKKFAFNVLFPQPPGLEEFRAQAAARAAEEAKNKPQTDTIENR